ncbi:TonB-dependent siderophore receptor, partial [Burkholderia pseudomallei]|nr:TonB-dependent siderophore receptor [Burkholderia pseudomallei]
MQAGPGSRVLMIGVRPRAMSSRLRESTSSEQSEAGGKRSEPRGADDSGACGVRSGVGGGRGDPPMSRAPHAPSRRRAFGRGFAAAARAAHGAPVAHGAHACFAAASRRATAVERCVAALACAVTAAGALAAAAAPG